MRLLPMVSVGWMGIGEVLVEGATSDESHHLHAQADAQNGDIGVIGEGLEELGLELLAMGQDADCGGVGWGVEGFGDRVVATGEDEGVEAFDKAGD